MSLVTPDRSRGVYKVEFDGGRRYVIYNASEIGNPPDHVPGKWYVLPYPLPVGLEAGRPFNTAEEAEGAARAWPAEAGDGRA